MSEQEKGLRSALEPQVMGAVGRVFENLDFDNCRYAGAWLGFALYGALGHRRSIAIQNVRLALGVSHARANQITRRSCLNFGMTFAEFMHSRVATPEEIRRQCSHTSLEPIMNGFEAGKGVVLMTAHIGNWEMMGARAKQEFPLTVIARPTSNSGVQKFIDESRAVHNVRVISKYDNGRAPLRVLKSNEALAILPDQHAGGEGALLPIFGQPTRVWTAVARLAMLSGARVIPAYGIRKRPFLANGRIEAQIFEGWNVPRTGDKETQVIEGTKRMIGELEKIIARNPDQWLWLHRRWREKDGAVFPK